jgi:hypothetical protein
MSLDPIRFAGGLNLYGYCDGNPVGMADPTGTEIVVQNPNPAHSRETWALIHDIERSGPRGRALVQSLRDSPFTIRIVPEVGGGPGNSPNDLQAANSRPPGGVARLFGFRNNRPGPGCGSTIKFDPFGPPIRLPGDPGARRVIILAHELIHAWRGTKGIRDPWDDEGHTTNLENLIREEMGRGFPQRSGYRKAGDLPKAPTYPEPIFW